jgi:hypothetical protein
LSPVASAITLPSAIRSASTANGRTSTIVSSQSPSRRSPTAGRGSVIVSTRSSARLHDAARAPSLHTTRPSTIEGSFNGWTRANACVRVALVSSDAASSATSFPVCRIHTAHVPSVSPEPTKPLVPSGFTPGALASKRCEPSRRSTAHTSVCCDP